jgi:uncharacterized protein YdeI (YjbR/CyaY-like superfamily)
VKSTKHAEGDAIRSFSTQDEWATWLEKSHRKANGLWLRLAKKDSGQKSITYAEALETAICYGWIDGQKRGESDAAWLQRFLPRGAKSIWSKINREKADRLIADRRMTSAGLEAVEAAKKDGRWDAAYDSPKAAEVPEDLQAALDANPAAKAFFSEIDRANRYAILFRIQTAKKAETRARKTIEFVEMLEKGEKIHPKRVSKGKSK